MDYRRAALGWALLATVLCADANPPPEAEGQPAEERIEVESSRRIAPDRYNDALAAKPVSELCREDRCDVPPALVSAAAPMYPWALQRAGVEGRASVVFDIDASGAPENVAVHSATHEQFGAAAVEAVKLWRFRPASRAGVPVVYRRALQHFPFELRD